MKSATYYDDNYLSKQKNVAVDNIPVYESVFKPHVAEAMTVLDFGCGAGVMLNSFECKYKIGVDVNDTALKVALENGVNEVHSNLDNIKKDSVDLIVSNSAIEHVPNPRESLQECSRILKPGGKIIFRVPHETLGWNYSPGDWNYHLYTWSPMAIGNLFNDVGFKNITVKSEKRMRPPMFKLMRKLKLEKFTGKLYRLLRLILEEIGLKRASVDGYSIVVAEK